VNGTEELARLLGSASEAPIESAGATAIFESICGGPLTAEITVQPAGEVTDEEVALLAVPEEERLHLRFGVLRCAEGIPAAEVTALVVTRRVPDPARAAMGITSSGRLMPGHGRMSLGRALRGLGVRREQLCVKFTPGCQDAWGQAQPLYSRARLRNGTGHPLALVTERVYACLLERFPPPWPCQHPGAQ
jgi:hypothetical protein